MRHLFPYLLFIATALVSSPALAQAVDIQAYISPNPLPVNRSGTYTVIVQTTSPISGGERPEVPGLSFANPQQVSNATYNSTTRSLVGQYRLSWSVTADAEGTFDIPSWTLQTAEGPLAVPAVSLTVGPPDRSLAEFFRLRLELPSGPVYVGQMIPARLSVLVVSGAEIGLRSGLERRGEAFLETPRSDSIRGRESFAGRNYDTYTYEFFVTPIRSGTHPLAYHLDISYRDPRPGRGSAVEGLRLETNNPPLNVLPLPEAGRPPSFSDAVGEFSMETSVSGTDLRVGEPLTLTLEISGQGNLDRLSAPALEETNGWRVYPPKATLESNDPARFRGSKRFEYILVPENEFLTRLPPVRFSYFNPHDQRYEEITSELPEVAVRPAAEGSALAQAYAPSALPALATPASPSGRRPLQTYASAWQSPPRPAFKNPAFLATNALVATAFATVLLWRRQQKRLRATLSSTTTHYRSRSRQAEQQALTAARAGERPAFFANALTALQFETVLALDLSRPPGSLHSSELLAALASIDLPPELRQGLEDLLSAADHARYGGQGSGNPDLSALATLLTRLLRTLRQASA